MVKKNMFFKRGIALALAITTILGNNAYYLKACEVEKEESTNVEELNTENQEENTNTEETPAEEEQPSQEDNENEDQEEKYTLDVTNDDQKGVVRVYSDDAELTNGTDQGNNVIEYQDITTPQIKISVEAKEGYAVKEVKFNDTVVEAQDGMYSIPLTENNTITVEYEKIETETEEPVKEATIEKKESQRITVRLLYLKADHTVDPTLTSTAEIKAGTATEMAKSLADSGKVEAGYKLSQTDGKDAVQVDGTVIYSASVVDGLTMVKTTEDEIGGVCLDENDTIDFYYETTNTHHVTYKILLDGKEVTDASNIEKIGDISGSSVITGDQTGSLSIQLNNGYLIRDVRIENGKLRKTGGDSRYIYHEYEISNLNGDAIITIKLGTTPTYAPSNLVCNGSNTLFTAYRMFSNYWETSQTTRKFNEYRNETSMWLKVRPWNQNSEGTKKLDLISIRPEYSDTFTSLNLPSTKTVGNTATTTIGAYVINVSYDGLYENGTPVHTVTFTRKDGGKINESFDIYVNHVDVSKNEVWLNGCTGVATASNKGGAVYLESDYKDDNNKKTIYEYDKNLADNFIVRGSGENNGNTKAYFNVAKGYNTDPNTIQVKLTSDGQEWKDSIKVQKNDTNEHNEYAYTFEIPKEISGSDVRFSIACQKDDSKVVVIYRINGEDQEQEIENGTYIKVGEKIDTSRNYKFIGWQHDETIYRAGNRLKIVATNAKWNNHKNRYEYVLKAAYSKQKTVNYKIVANVLDENGKVVFTHTTNAKGPEGKAIFVYPNKQKEQLLGNYEHKDQLMTYDRSAVTLDALKEGAVLTINYTLQS